MSFSFEFIARSPEDAGRIVAAERAPVCVKEFIYQALTAFASGPIFVKANGHLYANDYQQSNANIEVRSVQFKDPPA